MPYARWRRARTIAARAAGVLLAFLTNRAARAADDDRVHVNVSGSAALEIPLGAQGLSYPTEASPSYSQGQFPLIGLRAGVRYAAFLARVEYQHASFDVKPPIHDGEVTATLNDLRLAFAYAPRVAEEADLRAYLGIAVGYRVAVYRGAYSPYSLNFPGAPYDFSASGPLAAASLGLRLASRKVALPWDGEGGWGRYALPAC